MSCAARQCYHDNHYPIVRGFPVFRIHLHVNLDKHMSIKIFSEFRISISNKSSILSKFIELNFPVLSNFRN